MPLPPYNPDLCGRLWLDAENEKGERVFRCYDCGDLFHSIFLQHPKKVPHHGRYFEKDPWRWYGKREYPKKARKPHATRSDAPDSDRKGHKPSSRSRPRSGKSASATRSRPSRGAADSSSVPGSTLCSSQTSGRKRRVGSPFY